MDTQKKKIPNDSSQRENEGIEERGGRAEFIGRSGLLQKSVYNDAESVCDNHKKEWGALVHSCHPSTEKVKEEGSEAKGQLQLHSQDQSLHELRETLSQN